MRYEYPYFVRNIRELLQWFDKEKKQSSGRGLSSSQFPILGGRIKHFLKNNDISLEQFKTILWGVMNENEKVYSPAYAFHFVDDLEKYEKVRNKYEKIKEKKDSSQEVDFNREDVVNEENQEEDEEEFFDQF